MPISMNARVKALFGGSVENSIGPAKVTSPPLAASSAPVRTLDPITIASGSVSRGSNASAALYGFACNPSTAGELRQIPVMPFLQDALGNQIQMVYVAGGNNTFVGSTTPGRALAIADRGATCDLAPALVAPTPAITNIGTAGSTTYAYKVTAKNLVGETIAPSATSTTTGNAALSSTNYNRLTIPATTGAVAYVIYRANQYVAEIPANPGANTVYNDIGVASNASVTGPTRDDCGWVVAPAVNSVGVLQIVDLLDAPGTVGGRVRFRVPSAKSQYAS